MRVPLTVSDFYSNKILFLNNFQTKKKIKQHPPLFDRYEQREKTWLKAQIVEGVFLSLKILFVVAKIQAVIQTASLFYFTFYFTSFPLLSFYFQKKEKKTNINK